MIGGSERMVMNGGSVVAQLNPNGQFYWLHLDDLGSGRKMTDSSGNMTNRAEFDPYGKLLYEWSSPTNLNTRKFTGYERDAATGLDYAQARMYASEWGRFLSPDPLSAGSANMLSPKTFNRYSYASGDPVNRIDPAGLQDYAFSWSPPPMNLLTSGYGITGLAAVMEQLARAAAQRQYWQQFVQQGRGQQPSRPSMAGVKPKADIIDPAKERKVGCGAVDFKIGWSVSSEDVGKGGWLIQHVVIASNVKDLDGNPAKGAVNTEYWEAWQVDDKGKIYGGYIKNGGDNTDLFTTKSYGEGTGGTITIKGYAKYIQGYNLTSPPWGPYPFAGTLPARYGNDKPDGWTDDGALVHDLSIKFDCINFSPTEIIQPLNSNKCAEIRIR